MVIKNVNSKKVDVFWGIGWDSWARMEMGTKGMWRLSGGSAMPRRVFSEFRSRMIKPKGKTNNASVSK